MMNKLCPKMKNVTFLSVIMAIVLALSIVITAIFGVNYAATVKDQNTLTVTMNHYFYVNRLDDLKAVCEKEFKKLSVEYTYNGEMNGDECELVYVFDQTAKLDEVKASLKQAVAVKAAENDEWEFIEVATANETLQTNIPVGYIVRAAIAVAVFAVLAFVYVAIRYRLYMGVTVAIAILLSAVMTAAVVLLARIPVTSSILYAVVISSVLAAIFTVLTMNKIRSNTDELSAEEKVYASLATKEIAAITAALGASLVLVGAIATWSVRWFAICALVSLLVAALIGLVFVPAVYLPMKKAEDKAAGRGKSGYIGAESKAEAKTEE